MGCPDSLACQLNSGRHRLNHGCPAGQSECANRSDGDNLFQAIAY